ncbi:protein of unknown function [Burkholderia multivorans]
MRVRLLDLGVAQVGAARLRGVERPALLPGAVRRRGNVAQRVLHGRRAEPAGDPGRRVPDERGRQRREALLPARHRLRVSAHDQQDPARVPQVEGREGRRHPGGLYAVRPQRLPDHRREHQELRARRQDHRDLDDQRRFERAVLQGARQPGDQGDRRARRRVLGRRGGTARHRHPAARRASRRMELLHVGEEPGQHEIQGAVRRVGEGEQPARRREARHQRPDGGDVRRHPHVEAGGREGEEHRRRQGARRDDRPERCRAVGLHADDGRQPPSAQAGDDRRDPRRRAVQRRMEDQNRGPRAAVEPVHRGQPGQAGHRQLDSGVPAPLARGARLTAGGRSPADAARRAASFPRAARRAPFPPARIDRCPSPFAAPPSCSPHVARWPASRRPPSR